MVGNEFAGNSPEYTYLTVPPVLEMRSCVGLVLAGMAARAHIGVGNLEDAVELLESYHSGEDETHFRFTLREEGVIAEVAPNSGPDEEWHTVIELIS